MRTSTRWGPMAAVTGMVVATLAAAVLGGCSQDASAPVDEQQAKARSQQVIAALREAWGDDVIQGEPRPVPSPTLMATAA